HCLCPRNSFELRTGRLYVSASRTRCASRTASEPQQRGARSRLALRTGGWRDEGPTFASFRRGEEKPLQKRCTKSGSDGGLVSDRATDLAVRLRPGYPGRAVA